MAEVTFPYTADVSDANPALARQCEAPLNSYGGRKVFAGPCVTLKVHEDHRIAGQLLNTPGEGRVLVVDGGGLLNRPGFHGGRLV